MNRSKDLNVTLNVARVFAMLSVVCAHMDIKGNEIIFDYVHYCGGIGVVLFFILSGFFYRPEKYQTFVEMAKAKGKSVAIPWIVMGTMYFLGLCAFGFNQLSVAAYFKFLSGIAGLLYYITSLITFYILFYFLKNFKFKKTLCIICMLSTLLFIYLNAKGLVPYWKYNGNNLHIPLSWIGYFSLGFYLRDVDNVKIYEFIKKTRFLWIALFIVCAVTKVFFCEHPYSYYFYLYTIPYEIVGIMGIVSVSTFKILDNDFVDFLANFSFGIYFTHPFIAQILEKFYNYHFAIQIFSPLIVASVSAGLLYIGYAVAKLVKLDKSYCVLTGIRAGRNVKKETEPVKIKA